MRPLHDGVWLLFAAGDREVGGVTVPGSGPAPWMDATVVALGPEVPASLGIGVGDVVVANPYDGMPVEYGGNVFRNVPAGKLLAVMRPEEAPTS